MRAALILTPRAGPGSGEDAGKCGASPRVPPIPWQGAVSLRFAAMSGWGGLTAHISPKPPWCTAKVPVTSTLKPEIDEEKRFPGRREN